MGKQEIGARVLGSAMCATVAAFCAVLSACSNGSSGVAPAPEPTLQQRLYVAGGSSLLAYALPLTSGSAPLATVATGATAPFIAHDAGTTIAEVSDKIVKIYTAPLASSSMPIATFSTTGDGQPAFDVGGKLYVPDGIDVEMFSPPFSNASVATHVATVGLNLAPAPAAGFASAVALDHNAILYVAHPQWGLIAAYAPPYSAAPAFTIDTSDPAGVDCGGITGLAFDAVGNLYVSSRAINCGVLGVMEFDAPLGSVSAPLLTIAPPPVRASFQAAWGVAFDPLGKLYVSNDYLAGASKSAIAGNGGNVAVFAPPFRATGAPASVSTILPSVVSSIAIGL